MLEGLNTLPLALSALVIFSLRIVDVTLGTLRIGFLVRGTRRLAGLFGFFESLVWLMAAAEVLSNLDSPLKFVAYAGGYATGTMVGVSVERWLAIGETIMRVVAPVGSVSVETALREAGFFVTVLNAQGRDGDVRVSFSVLPRRRMQEALALVGRVNPAAFVTFEPTTPTRRSLAAKPSRPVK
ncbi:MAG: DUF5698 domain-containing protein [Polyangiaceae bacterium]|nr:DUF5698 domain-containing protein [Polyangiaceae bacterium]